MLHADTPMSPDLEAGLRQVCEALPEAELAGLARTEPDLQAGGFRAGKPAAIRTRLWQIAVGSALIPDSVRRLLAAHSLNRPLISRLSVEVLQELRQELGDLCGGPRLLLGMLLDARSGVRDLARTWLEAGPPAAPATHEAWRDEKIRLTAQLREARAENRRLQAVAESLARSREQLQAAQAAGEGLRAQLEETAGLLSQVRREREEARTELAREVSRREERVRAAVDARLATEYAGWLAPARRLEGAAAAADASAGELLARAEAALARQAAADRHSGNRALLRARLDQAESLLARVRDSLADAVRQTPELRQAEQDLVRETGRLHNLLGHTPAATPCETALAAHVNGAHINDLPHLRALVARLAEIGALEPAAINRLDAQLARRQAIAQADGDLPEEDGTTAVGRLQRALAGRQPAILLVDGHNALFGLQGRYLAPQGSAVPDGNKRDRLVADVVHRFKGRPTCRAWIVFDGPEASDASPAPNVRVTYSGGKGANRADGVLLDNVRFFRAVDPSVPILLVSNDHALGAEARRLGAQVLTALELGGVL